MIILLKGTHEAAHLTPLLGCRARSVNIPDIKVHGTSMGPIWGRQDPGGRHVGPMDFAIWDATINKRSPSPAGAVRESLHIHDRTK